MSGLASAVDNGPRAVTSREADIKARIEFHDARARTLQDRASAHARRARGDGPLAKWHRVKADSLAVAADRHRAKANALREQLAKAKARQAKAESKRVKWTVESTRHQPKPGQAKPPRPGQQAKPPSQPPGQPAGPGGQPGPDHDGPWPVLEPVKPPQALPQARPGQDGPHVPAPPQLEGPHHMPVTGEATNVEQTEANLTALEEQIGDLSNSIEGMSGSLASLGLDNFSGALARIQDALDSAKPGFEGARDHLAKHKDIAERAAAAGEMAESKTFYGV